MKTVKLTIAALLFLALSLQSFAQNKFDWKKISVLVYTKNGKGYVHANIPSAIACIQKLGSEYGFKVDTSSDAAIMTKSKLEQYTLLVFASTNNDVFDTDEQRLAFRHYIEAGGGLVGIHSVLGTERNWKWFKMLLGGTFAWHPKFQELTVKALHNNHPSLKDVPKEWVRKDECYFAKELYPGRTVLMAYDLNSLIASDSAEQKLIAQHKGTYADLYPAVWSYQFDGGHTWCTALGHDPNDYSDPVFVNHILQGIQFIAASRGKLDYKKSYAVKYDDPLRF